MQEFAFLSSQMLFIREGGSKHPVRAAYLEDIIPGAHVCNIHPLAINVMPIGVPTTDSHSLLPKVGTGIAPLQSCKEGVDRHSGRVGAGLHTLPHFAGTLSIHLPPAPMLPISFLSTTGLRIYQNSSYPWSQCFSVTHNFFGHSGGKP